MAKNILLAFGVALLASAFAAEDPDAIYKQGIAKLREAQADHSALVPATKLLARAADLYEKAGDEAKVAEVNACLYWAKKKMTLADTEAVKAHVETVKRLDNVAKPVAVSESKAMLDRAEAFAKGYADDPLLTAIRYFEVADRFPESPEGRKAMSLSLAVMQKVGEKAKLETYKPAPTDGKVFVKSEPSGAAIILVAAEGGKMDTGKVTPALVELPVGKQALQLSARGCRPSSVTVEVNGRAIARPDVFKLEPLTTQVDIVYEDGWLVFVDGKPARVVGEKNAGTPCTVELPLGRHELGLGKEGFLDIRQQVEVTEAGIKGGNAIAATSLEVKSRPSKGTSQLFIQVALEAKAEAATKTIAEDTTRAHIAGKYKGTCNAEWTDTVAISPDGTFRQDKLGQSGRWQFKDEVLILNWEHFPPDTLKMDEKGNFKGTAKKEFTLTLIEKTDSPVEQVFPERVFVGGQLVIWNEHNSAHNNNGTDECNAILLMADKEVWRKDSIVVPWKPGRDMRVAITLPILQFNKIRIEVKKWHELGGGLSEVELLIGGRNVIKNAVAKASAESSPGDLRCAQNLTDGITTSSQHCVGYWLLPDGQEGWVEIDLTRYLVPRPDKTSHGK